MKHRNTVLGQNRTVKEGFAARTDERIKNGMERQYSWKRAEEMEIDAGDLLYRLFKQWKQIAACAIACALILAGYRYLKDRNVPDRSGTAEETVLTESEEQAVTDAIQLGDEMRSLEKYMDSSVLMKLDPYYRSRYILLYRIDHAERQELPGITESYLNYIVNGGVADDLRRSGNSVWKMDRPYVAELLTAYQKTYSFPFQISVDSISDSQIQSESLFYVDITGKNAEAAEKMAMDMQDALKKIFNTIKKAAGNHRLVLVSSVLSITADSGLLSQQHDKKALLSSKKAALKTAEDSFSEEQMAVYEETAGMEKKEDRNNQEEQEKSESEVSPAFGMKYALFGLIGGIFAYCFIYSCWYIFHDTVKNIEEIKRTYMFPVYGGIQLESKKKKENGIVTSPRQDAYGYTEEQVFHRIRLACRKQGVTKLCAASAFSLNSWERECLERISGRLKGWGIDMIVTDNPCADTSLWNVLIETGNVLMMCKTGMTTHRMINHTMDFYFENGISVIGAVAFLQDE